MLALTEPREITNLDRIETAITCIVNRFKARHTAQEEEPLLFLETRDLLFNNYRDLFDPISSEATEWKECWVRAFASDDAEELEKGLEILFRKAKELCVN